MPAANPRIFASFTLSNTGGASDATVYNLHRTEGVSVTETPITDMIEDGQTLQNGFDTVFTIDCYDLAVLSDARVQYGGGTIPTTKARLVLTGASGGATETTDGLRFSGQRVYDDQQRAFARITATRKSVNTAVTIS